ncbi:MULTISPECIES: EpsG family protein [Amniculibacterium]|uniref:EpsG family protein n=1 Tax=Amniculibacterium TaxID=2715289 RepID=UPI000F5A3F88|nr:MULTISPECIES: EpsG family protein [Amniculibacterium]
MKEFNFTYFLMYAFFVFFALLFALKVDVRRKQAQTLGVLVSVFFMTAIVILFGLRDYKVGTDTLMYKYQYTYYKKIDFGTEILVKWFMAFVHGWSNDPRYYIFSLSALYLLVLYLASLVFSRKFQYNVLFVLFSFVSLYSFQSLGVNIVRQGVSLAFLLLAVALYLRNPRNVALWLLAALCSVGFHVTSIAIIVVLILVNVFRKLPIKYYTVLYFVFVVLAYFKVSLLSLGPVLGDVFAGDRKSKYIDGSFDKEFSIGFKPQFVIFNTLFLLIFFLIRKYGQKQENYDVLFKTYMALSMMFFMMFQLPFSDRWGVMSWMFIPFLLAPAFAENGQYRTSIVSVLFLAIIFVIFQSMYYQS